MANIVLVGGQWGDEGKGKVVDLLAPRFQVVARFAGGPNAGHTVRRGDAKYALRHIPSGVLSPDVICVIGNGVVIDPASLLEEIRDLTGRGVILRDRFFLSERAHVILPAYLDWEKRREESRDVVRIGTTRRGVGPAYAGKFTRTGLRVIDLYDRSRLDEALASAMGLFGGGDPAGLADTSRSGGEEVARAREACLVHADALRPYVTDTAKLIEDRMRAGESILFEGAQGTLLDIDHGTYPFVTSSSATAGGACTGLGVGPTRIDGVIGIFKAYCTRVGEGPFPSEEKGPEGDRLRERGREYGTVTGRPRRCGWFDAVAARYAVRVSGMDSAAITLLDVLDEFDEILVATAYRHGGGVITEFPAETRVLAGCEPEYTRLKGWRKDTTGCRSFDDLPSPATDYIRTIEDLIECDIDLVSVGPGPESSLMREVSKLSAWF